jgi:glycosyltransferase involved in cell wall biosynthesis
MINYTNDTDRLKNKILALIGSNSIHTIRYLNAVAPYFDQIIFITNAKWENMDADDINITTYIVDFGLLHFGTHQQIANILQKHNIELVHIQQANSYAFHGLWAIKKSKLKCKTILTTWGSDILILPFKNLLYKHMVKFNLANASIITSGSLYMSAKILSLAPDSAKIYTINFGVKNFPPQLDMNQKQNIILSNRLHKPLYNIDKIINAFAAFIKNNLKYADYKLIIAASGSETANLIGLVNNLCIAKSVDFIGMVSYEKLLEYYKKAKIFISIPDSDSTALSVREAMSYGCYPILSNIPANLESVLDEINGTICQNNNMLTEYILAAVETANLHKTAQFNHDLIAQKAVFEKNLPKFLDLY